MFINVSKKKLKMKLIIWVNKDNVESMKDFIKGNIQSPPIFTTTNLDINQIAIILTIDDYYKLKDNT